MSAKNRTDLKAEVTAWAAMLDLETTHKPTEINILDSVLLNRDITSSITKMSAGATSLYFTGYDAIHLSTAYDADITISGLNAGEYKFLLINKTAGVKITFANGIDGTYNNAYVDGLTRCAYMVTHKGTYTPLQYFITPLFKTFDFSAIPVAEAPTNWQQVSTISPWTATSNRGMRAGLWYRTNRGFLDISLSVSRTLAGSPSIALLPSGARPAFNYVANPICFNAANLGDILIDTAGNLEFTNYTTYPTSLSLTISIPLT